MKKRKFDKAAARSNLRKRTQNAAEIARRNFFIFGKTSVGYRRLFQKIDETNCPTFANANSSFPYSRCPIFTDVAVIASAPFRIKVFVHKLSSASFRFQIKKHLIQSFQTRFLFRSKYSEEQRTSGNGDLNFNDFFSNSPEVTPCLSNKLRTV